MQLLKQLKQPELSAWKTHSKFPLLLTTTKNGKKRLWACWVINDTVYRTDGFVTGKLKTPQTHSYSGNTLRSGNEQAPLEAEKMWLKQIDRGYAPASDDTRGQKVYNHVKKQKMQNGGMNRGVRLFSKTEINSKTTAGAKAFGSQHRPMLAKKYKDWKKENYCLTSSGKAIVFPALAQAKVDGIRALPQLDNDQVMLESRNGNSFVHLEHIREEIKYWLTRKGHPDLILDGEMYAHCLYRDEDNNPTYNYTNKEMKAVERYQFISEACKITRSNPHQHEELVEYWIFDIWDPSKTNQERWELLKELFDDYDGDILKLVPTRIVQSHQEIEDYMAELIGETSNRQGYEFEGVMIRQASAKYVASTTHQSCLLKYKRFEDEEWEICGAERCDGGLQDGAIKWICKKMVAGKVKRVTAKQIGDTETSKRLYSAYKKKPQYYNGKMLNIRFNDRTKDGVPRFPRATAIVDDK